MKKYELERLSPLSRRKLLGWTLNAFGGAFFAQYVAREFGEILFPQAVAQEIPGGSAIDGIPTYFIEINLRDQFDFNHLFTPPGIARAAGLIVGESGDRATYFEKADKVKHLNFGAGTYLTQDSESLAPHADSVACIDLCELPVGVVHGHEGGNSIRSPGRLVGSSADGRQPMWSKDYPNSDNPSEMALYSRTPTPAALHNHVQRSLRMGAQTKDGPILKIHTSVPNKTYNTAAGLKYGSMVRYFSKDDVLRDFNQSMETVTPSQNLPSALSPDESQALRVLMKSFDMHQLAQRGASNAVTEGHIAQLETALDRKSLMGAKPVSLRTQIELTPQERTEWETDSVTDVYAGNSNGKISSWEVCSIAVNLILTGQARTVALELDYMDWHDRRPETAVRHYARMIAHPLSRMIAQLKAAGIYDRTLIAVYTTDGGRPPNGGNSGDRGRNGVLLAGGMIRGGYWGDVRVKGPQGDGHQFSYHAPDPITGQPHPLGTTGNDLRISGASLWKTVMRAAGVPATVVNSFPDVANAQELSFLLKK